MLRIACQTAGPIWLIFFVDTHGYPGGVIEYKKSKLYFFKIFFIYLIFFHSPSASIQYTYAHLHEILNILGIFRLICVTYSIF